MNNYHQSIDFLRANLKPLKYKGLIDNVLLFVEKNKLQDNFLNVFNNELVNNEPLKALNLTYNKLKDELNSR